MVVWAQLETEFFSDTNLAYRILFFKVFLLFFQIEMTAECHEFSKKFLSPKKTLKHRKSAFVLISPLVAPNNLTSISIRSEIYASNCYVLRFFVKKQY